MNTNPAIRVFFFFFFDQEKEKKKKKIRGVGYVGERGHDRRIDQHRNCANVWRLVDPRKIAAFSLQATDDCVGNFATNIYLTFHNLPDIFNGEVVTISQIIVFVVVVVVVVVVVLQFALCRLACYFALHQ